MDRFHIIDDGAAILFSKGVYRQAKVYRRGKDVFAGYGAGFIKLGTATLTSLPAVAYYGLEGEGVSRAHDAAQPRWTGAAE